MSGGFERHLGNHGRRPPLRLRLFPQLVVLLAAWAGVSGCIGPTAIRYTRLRYNEVVRDTNDQQLLLEHRAAPLRRLPGVHRLAQHHQPVRDGRPGQLPRGLRPGDPGPDEPRLWRAVASRYADPELPPARGAGDRQGAADPVVGRPADHCQRWVQPRAAPALLP